MITKSDDRAPGVRIGRQEVLLPINHKNDNFREKKNSQVMKEWNTNIKKTDEGEVNILKADLHGTTLSHTTSARLAYDMNCFL